MPGSLAGQFALSLLLALAIAQGIAMVLFTVERSEAVCHVYRDNVIERAGTVARLLRHTSPALHGAILDAASAGQRFSPEFRERHIHTRHTGDLVAVDT